MNTASNHALASAATRIAKLEPRQQPQAADLIQELRDAVLAAQSLGVFDKIKTAHETRRCLWAGQSADGMLHGEKAFPWDGAIDTRVPLADEIVSEQVRIRMAALRAGNVQIGPQEAVNDTQKAQTWDGVLRYYRQQIKRNLKNQFKLFFTCVEEIGYGIMHVDWRDQKRLKPITLTREQIVQALANFLIEDQARELNMDPEQMHPDLQKQAADDAAIGVEMLLADETREADAMGLLQRIDPTMPESEARKTARALRKADEAVYYAPRSKGGLPCIKARIPWVHCLHNINVGPDGQASFYADVERMTEVDVRIRAEQEGWSEAALAEVLKHANQGLPELMGQAGIDNTWLLNGVGIGLSIEQEGQQRTPMYEIVTIYRLAVNSAGIPAVYESVINVNVDMILSHECCEVTSMPTVFEQREPAALAVQSRGIPEIILTDQLGLKKLKDASTAAAELSAYPPSERTKDDDTKMQPGAVFVNARQSGNSGTQQRFAEVPGVDEGALKFMEATRADVDRLFCRGKWAAESPDMRRIYVEDIGEAAVLTYEAVIDLLWQNVQAYVNTVTASRIAGRPVSIKASAEDLEGSADVNIEFSPLALNQEMALKLAEWATKLAPLDRSGRIDFGALVELLARVFDITFSESIIMPGEAASAQIEKDEQDVLSAIATDQYVTGHVNSPQARWKKVQEWLANPTTVAMLQQVPTRYAALQEHIKALNQEMQQTTTNVFWGQTGQSPIPPWQQQQQPEQALEMAVEGAPPMERMAA